jgi:hypothetical protein
MIIVKRFVSKFKPEIDIDVSLPKGLENIKTYIGAGKVTLSTMFYKQFHSDLLACGYKINPITNKFEEV